MTRRPWHRHFWVGAVDAAFVRCIGLAVCFFAGAMAGHMCARGLDAHDLSAYLEEFSVAGSDVSLISCVLLYYGYVLLAFLLGFSSVGVILIPGLSSVLGFLSMYTLSCFTAAFGRSGIMLALSVLSVRLLFTLPCFLAVASSAWSMSGALAVMVLGKGKRTAAVHYDRSYFLLCLLCVVILTAGIFCERFITPVLFRLALERLMLF